MTTITEVSLKVGKVISVEGNEIRLGLTSEFLECALSERFGQPGGYRFGHEIGCGENLSTYASRT